MMFHTFIPMKIYCYKYLSGRTGRGIANQGVTSLLHSEFAIIKIVIKMLPHEADGRFIFFGVFKSKQSFFIDWTIE